MLLQSLERRSAEPDTKARKEDHCWPVPVILAVDLNPKSRQSSITFNHTEMHLQKAKVREVALGPFEASCLTSQEGHEMQDGGGVGKFKARIPSSQGAACGHIS
jgi:hypothetical protein